MVKSGSFKVSPGSLGARIGTGLGQGLGEQIPKEVDRYRLSQGLQNFAKNAANLNPLEAYAQASAIPGITPQMIQALPELLKLQQQRQAYSNGGVQSPQEAPEMQSGGIGSQGNAPRSIQGEPQGLVQPGERGQPTIQESNPLRESAIPRKPWTPQRFDREVGKMLDSGKANTVPEAMALAKANEARDMALPEAEQKADAYYAEQQQKVDEALQKKLKLKLETDEKGLFKDLSGETLNNLNRNMYKDLRTSGPDVSTEDVAEYWSQKGLDLVKAKDELKKLQAKPFYNKLTSGKENLEKLKSEQKIFAETGNEEEFYDKLRTGTNEGGFGLSPQAAATIAYPLSSNVKSYVNKVKPTKTLDVSFVPAKSRKYAVELEKVIRPEDSFLAIARDLRQKDPGFDQRSFFSQLREDQDTMGITPRQKRELVEGESEVFLNWSDLLYFPLFRD